MLGRMVLLLHFWSHLPVLKSKLMNTVIGEMVSTFVRIPIGVYYMHHVRCHHTENNQRGDPTTTNPYRRDRFLHYLVCAFRFTIIIWAETAWYGITTSLKLKRYRELVFFVAGAASFPIGINWLAKTFGWPPILWTCV